jgi:Protein of unknown function (DUF1592)/Protein of unknown function (DUF1588)/Protein of unknown function (DUF1595)/Protein of unknown function (DUF1587)/Protein of unknown function (DUF1585)
MIARLATLASLLILGTACSGEIGGLPVASRSTPKTTASGSTATGEPGKIDRSQVADCSPTAIGDPGLAISRRLTRTDYDNTVRDLLGDSSAPASNAPTAFPGEELSLNFDNNPQMLSVSAPLVQSYFDAAEALSTKAVQNLATLVGTCASTGGTACADQFIRSFGAKAFRRPVTDDDVTRFMGPYNVGAQTDFKTGIRLVVSAMLQSAPFLYRLEMGGVAAGAYVRPTSFEMASRLSYFLWKSMPDSALLKAAQDDQLQTSDQIRAQAVRMLGASQTHEMVGNFHDQWLNLRLIEATDKSASDFPMFNETVAADMHTEASTFIGDVLFGGAGDASALFSAPTTFVNANLAKFYGFGSGGAAFAKMTPPVGERAGVLTMGGVMSVLAKTNRTSPVLRGKFIREQVLCEEVPAPPPNVPALPEIDTSLTVKQRLGEHEVAGCAACHVLLDPVGWAFENYDGVGRFRTVDNGHPIDIKGEVQASDTTDPMLVGAFSGPAELGAKLAASSEVKRCIVTQWFRFAAGRSEADADVCSLQKLDTKFASTGHSVKDLLVELTQTDAFLYRRRN